MKPTSSLWCFAAGIGLVCVVPRWAAASEAGQGVFETVLDDHPVHCSPGSPITTGYTSAFSFDDKTFTINLPPGNNRIDINFSVLGAFTSAGTLNCVFDEGGTFNATAVDEAGDFQWTEISGEYMDRKPDISEGDPFPFVGSARCQTTRTDDFKTLCDNFEFSFNGLAKAQAPNAEGFFHDFAGDFTLRAAPKADVMPGGGGQNVGAEVDGPGGSVPEVQVTFKNGVSGPGDLRVATLADAHGSVPPGVEFPVRGTTEVDHGSGPVPFFEGGDERFVDLTTNAALPAGTRMEVCLPMPVAAASEVRPVRVLHGEGSDASSRRFVDRTSRVDPTAGKVCAAVSSFSRFAVVTTDYCGNGQRRSDGLLTIAGGLLGKRTVVVDGLTDCTQYPAALPSGLRRYCVPDADPTPGQCGIALTLGINRGACSRVRPDTADPHSPSVDVNSYEGTLKQGGNSIDLTAIFGPDIAALSNPVEATVGPKNVAMAATRKITTYRLKHQLSGIRPGTLDHLDTDKDVLTIKCIDPTQF
jgi:hypothetical protein